MTKIFLQGDYTTAGAKGLLRDGGSGREQAVQKLAASLGGSLDSIHFSASSPSYFIILNVPDKVSAASLATAVIASGAVTINQSVEILTPSEMDAAVKKDPAYRAPGA